MSIYPMGCPYINSHSINNSHGAHDALVARVARVARHGRQSIRYANWATNTESYTCCWCSQFYIRTCAPMSPPVEGINEPQNSDGARSDEEQPLLRSKSTNRPPTMQTVSSLLQNWWLWEVLAMGTSLLSVTMITVILLSYDSSALPDWPSIITVRQCSSYTLGFDCSS